MTCLLILLLVGPSNKHLASYNREISTPNNISLTPLV